MPKILVGISTLLMTLSIVFGYLNSTKVKSLHNDMTATTSARDIAERARAASDKKFKDREKEFKTASDKATAAEAKEKEAEDELSKAQSGRAELEAKVQTNETQIADLQKRVADAAAGAPASADGAAPNDLKAQLDDTKKQLEAAEQEKAVLADKVKSAQDRASALEEEKKRRAAGNPAGLHGTVLAVNQAYNFVVLSLGDRQGIVPNSEMLVMRQGSLIGRIRISSVEPTTSIGDIITNTLARGVQVLPGDTVIYAGNNS